MDQVTASLVAQSAWHPVMTWNLFLTAVIVPAVGWIIVTFIKRSIKHSDELADARAELVKQDLKAAHQLNDSVHTNLSKKIDTFCGENKDEHKSLWDHHEHHSHDDRGKVTFTG